MNKQLLFAILFVFVGVGAAMGQEAPLPNQDSQTQGGGPPPPFRDRRPPLERAFHAGPPGRWWNNPEFVKLLNLTPDQQRQMEAVFQQNKPHLIDLSTAVRQDEAAMEPLLAADQPDEAKVLAQIDRMAQARAELEKSSARMLLALRRVLTPAQWKQLQANEPHEDWRFHHPFPGHGPMLGQDHTPNPSGSPNP